MIRRVAPAVYSIAAGLPFVDVLADGLLARYGDDTAAALARVTVLVPTRRAAKTLGEAFLRRAGGRATLLPTMHPIGDVDEDELLILSGAAALDLDLPPAAPPLWRQAQLSELVIAWERRLRGAPPSPAQAAALAAELARFLDQVETEGLDLKKLQHLAPEDYAEHWQRTLDFLRIISEHWPKILKSAGFMAAAARRDRLLRQLTTLWRQQPPQGPVIAAGSTGSIPSTAALLKVVARLPQGAVVLPGLDLELDQTSWAALGPTHPQATMKRLLEDIQAAREEVRPWLAEPPSPARQARRRLISLALLPPAATDAWRDHKIDLAPALSGLHLVEAASPREEAGAIALAMREALEEPGRTAALITPDRALARRVAAALKRWGIAVDDSAGAPLTETPPGVFLLLLAELAAGSVAPAPLLAALKHPLAAGGMAAGDFRARVRELDRLCLRGPRPASGLAGVADVVARHAPPRLRTWWADVSARLEPLIAALRAEASVASHVAAHVAAAEALAASDSEDGASRLWTGEAGEAASQFLAELMETSAGWRIAGADYPALLKVLMKTVTVRPVYGRHPRLKIWGPLEARLQQADLVILGGLNEGSWPPDPGVDPWLSRPMRADFGLPPLERRIGQAAHDFAQAAAAPRVILTRSTRVDGAPTVPSRWLLRLAAVLGEEKIPAGPWRSWHGAQDRPAAVAPCSRPAPTPPIAARPRQLSVTQLQTWMRDPYAIYARHILKLEPLDPLDADPGAAEKGTVIHQALEEFVRAYPVDLPADALDQLLSCGQRAFAAYLDRPAVRAFWWPRFLHVAQWFIATEQERRLSHQTVLSEERGRMPVAAPGLAEPFTVIAKADRIDRTAEGLVVIDYKTGNPPSARELHAGFAPQLPVEALIAEAGGFKGVPAAAVAGLEFWRLSGGEPAGKITAMKEIARLKAAADQGLRDLVALFARPETPYLSQPRPAMAPAGDFDHLARIKEWGSVAALGGEEKNS